MDNEASEDEAARKEFPLARPSSHEANAEFIEKANRYRNILAEASESDEHIRQKWDEWEENVAELTLDEVIARILDIYWSHVDSWGRAYLKLLYHQVLSTR